MGTTPRTRTHAAPTRASDVSQRDGPRHAERGMTDTTTTSTAIRAAGLDDVTALATALARAFHDDPVFAWCLPAPERRAGLLPAFFEVLARAVVPHEASEVT